ncbi:hypothetical protein TELCIR_19021, partial [Teladorsagia circumcincta]
LNFRWRVIKLLGSGGFGDVYKVQKVNNPDKTRNGDRWTAGVTRLDHTCNDTIDMVTWYDMVRAHDDSVRKIALNFNVPGKRPRGRPKQRWLDTLHEDLKVVSLHPDKAQNREKWRQHIRKADPATAAIAKEARVDFNKPLDWIGITSKKRDKQKSGSEETSTDNKQEETGSGEKEEESKERSRFKSSRVKKR